MNRISTAGSLAPSNAPSETSASGRFASCWSVLASTGETSERPYRKSIGCRGVARTDYTDHIRTPKTRSPFGDALLSFAVRCL